MLLEEFKQEHFHFTAQYVIINGIKYLRNLMHVSQSQIELRVKVLFSISILLFVLAGIFMGDVAWHLGLRQIAQTHCDPRTWCGRLLQGAPDPDSLAQSSIVFARGKSRTRLANLLDNDVQPSDVVEAQIQLFTSKILDIPVDDVFYIVKFSSDQSFVADITFYDRRDSSRRPFAHAAAREIVYRWYILSFTY